MRGLVTLTPIAERLAVDLLLPVLAGIRTPNISLAVRTLLPTAPPPLQNLAIYTPNHFRCRNIIDTFSMDT